MKKIDLADDALDVLERAYAIQVPGQEVTLGTWASLILLRACTPMIQQQLERGILESDGQEKGRPRKVKSD